LGPLLTFVSGRVRRGTRAARDAGPVAEQPVVADRTGIRSLLAAEAVGQVGNMMVFVAGPWSYWRPPAAPLGPGSSPERWPWDWGRQTRALPA